jgi:PIN domain nuclease of toxin-antitoxin system
MRFLLDTSVVLWSVAEDYKLNSRAMELLSSKASELYLSPATAWEIAIKYALGTLPLHTAAKNFIPEAVRGMGLHTLDITLDHAIEAGQLPRHHRDPFDRMLIAQARLEKMTLLTADRVFQKYGVEMMFCGN